LEVVMSTLHRAQLLLEAEQHQALAEIARQEGRSLSDLVRDILRQHLVERETQARQLSELQALEELTRIRDRLRAEHGVLQNDLLAEARAEREQEIDRLWRGGA
jgi:metal-responsive CopG/Arc/MetJ family transcriptional regulator